MRLPTLVVLTVLLLMSCDKNEEIAENHLSVISLLANGSALSDGMEDIPVDSDFVLVFSAALDTERFRSALSIHSATNEVPLDISFSNALTKATVTAAFENNTEYILHISTAVIGAYSRRLETSLTIQFTTADNGIVKSMSPCISGGDCLRKVNLNFGNATADFGIYSSYPIYDETAAWENLKYAVIVVHGQNRDADNYFDFLTTTLANEALEDSTALISPWFKTQADAGVNELYWTSSDWREGRNSDDKFKISSFTVIDSLIKQLTNKDRFPVLRKIIITGHSSGGLFTHLYAGSSKVASSYPEIEFQYVTANSQYYYYPNNYRYDEQTKDYFVPADCFDYNFWPIGFRDIPDYLQGINEEDFNEQFIKVDLTYLIGNRTESDGTLNTTDCDATLLGSSRYQRGENIYRLMQKYYSGVHSHSRIVVKDIGHDGERMYRSSEFTDLVNEIIND